MESANNACNVHACCLMPDHLLAEGIEPSNDPPHFATILKMKVADRQYATQPGGALWQKRFYNPVLRSLESVEPVAWYIWLNPLRKDLVERPHEYAFHHGRDGTAPILDLKTRRHGRPAHKAALQNLPNPNRSLDFLPWGVLRPRHRFL